MRILNGCFQNKAIDYDKLTEYGFSKNNTVYLFETTIHNNDFKVIVYISENKQYSKIIDLSIDEEYVLADVSNSVGEFVGKIKEEYDSIINDIINKCTGPNIFKSKQAIEIIKYVKDKYNDDLEYLWAKFPDNAVWRNKKNNKWFGALMTIEESKINIESNRKIEIIDLRYQKESIKDFIDNKRIFAGYHMNKNNWITIRLDESIDTIEIFKLIDNSYNISLSK